MKRKILSLTAALLCAVLLGATLAGCSQSRPIQPSEQDIKEVGSVGEFAVLYEELIYVTRQYKAMLESKYGKGIWDTPDSAALYREELTREVCEALTANYAILELCAEVLIYSDDPDIEERVDSYISALIKEWGGRAAYIDQLEAEGITDHFFRFCIAVDYCYSELFYVYIQDLNLIETDEDKIFDRIMSGSFARTVHVYIQNDEGDSVEQNRRLAEDVRRRLSDGEDINKIIGSSVNEDFDLTTTDGYYFTRGEMVEPYETAAFALQEGGISEVVETATGFYVIKRLPLEEKYVMKNLAALTEQYQYAEINKIIDTRRESLTFSFNEYGKTLDLTQIG